MMKYFINSLCLFVILCLTACSSQLTNDSNHYLGKIDDPIMVIVLLKEQQQNWTGTPYRLGGLSRRGIDCSGFVQITFLQQFNLKLPRTTTEQAKYGKAIAKQDIQTGDLIFFKTGRGPNGYHVGIYVENGKFLHASAKGVGYSSIENAYWKRTFWQVRRI